jgi:hypothetical protein
LDALEALPPFDFSATVWRVTRAGRDPLRGSVANGRWNSADELEVLYTALEHDGALAEIGYRLKLEPIWPSKLSHQVHEVKITVSKIIDLSLFPRLEALGVDVAAYESFGYSETQAIASAANFLELDGILVPNARHPTNNLVLFFGSGSVLDGAEVVSTEDVDWNMWRAKNRDFPSRSR